MKIQMKMWNVSRGDVHVITHKNSEYPTIQ